ncbi:hypothetical protein ACFQ12_27755, partial [Methylobacterium trifolii]
MTDPIPPARRNPRRWYDEAEIEQPPATVSDARTAGAYGVVIHCTCGRVGTVRRQMIWDIQRCSGAEALVHLG